MFDTAMSNGTVESIWELEPSHSADWILDRFWIKFVERELGNYVKSHTRRAILNSDMDHPESEC